MTRKDGLVFRERGAFGNYDHDGPPEAEPMSDEKVFTRAEHETLLRAAIERAVKAEAEKWQNEVITAREARDKADAELERMRRERT